MDSGKPVIATSNWHLFAAGLLLLTSALTGLAQPIQIDSVVAIDAYGVLKRYQPSGTLYLPAQENYLTFHCSAPQPTPVFYRLASLDVDWRSGWSTDRFHYANLVGDAYQFQVRSALPGGLSTVSQLDIRLAAPFWKRVWFWPMIILYIVGVISVVVYLFVRYRFLQKLRVLKVRDRIARDLHDDMGSYLSSISILSATLPADPDRARQNLDRIGQTARQVMDAMSDIVWSINPSQDTMQQVIDRMNQVADELFANTDTDVVFSVEPGVETMSLPLERRRDFFLIYKEALTNAARYASASRVEVGLDREGERLRLTISDNGRGFDPAHPTPRSGGGNGQRNMQARAEALSGTFSVQSAPKQGTRVRFTLPL